VKDMTSVDVVNSYLAELGLRVGIKDLRLSKNLRCQLSYPNGLLTIEAHNTQMFCFLYCDLMSMNAPGLARELQLLKLAHLNFLGIETGGAILSINPENECINLSHEIDLQRHDYLDFETQLSRFILKTEVIKTKVLDIEDKKDDFHSTPFNKKSLDYFVKV
jgi:hypothetical protein